VKVLADLYTCRKGGEPVSAVLEAGNDLAIRTPPTQRGSIPAAEATACRVLRSAEIDRLQRSDVGRCIFKDFDTECAGRWSSCAPSTRRYHTDSARHVERAYRSCHSERSRGICFSGPSRAPRADSRIRSE